MTETMTEELELSEPLDLCSPDGRRLNSGARGWSRFPLHHANLNGSWGRTKKWDYLAVQTDELAVSVTLADIDYIGLATVEWIDLKSGKSGGQAITVPLARGVDLPASVCEGRIQYRSKAFDLMVSYESEATTIVARWTEADGSSGSLDIAMGSGSESLNVVIPWSDKRFQITSKHQGLPTTGRLIVDGRVQEIGGSVGDAWGTIDIGRGRWPYNTRWNWGGGAGTSVDGQRVAIQLGGKWTEGTGFTENGVFINGKLHKIGEELSWDYSWDEPMKPWRVHSADESLDVTLTPVYDRHDNTNLGLVVRQVHQVFGHWSGTVPDGPSSTTKVQNILGFAEESRARW